MAIRQSVSRSQLLRPSFEMLRLTCSIEATCIPPTRPILQPSRRRVVIELLNCVCVVGGVKVGGMCVDVCRDVCLSMCTNVYQG